ncbi:DUF1566 domain-containing protein [uncultured Thiodictyon sp.]|uniref:Lcl C-terminal domain-containing protein n=1 Tax=uncultured Thiodictyon sp. TaxID=1846217 RepID=UPI0025CE14C0|nr:DUF1566 domain-containing protein [uncultured Thiodictyon sp.]
MYDKFLGLAAVLLLSAVGAGAVAQTCNTRIPSTAPDSRFTEHGDGTVSDAATGLMWMQCTVGVSGVGCLNGAAATFTWQNALQQAMVANAAGVAGHTDWRLPNKNELESLVERRCYAPAINATYFPNMPPSSVVWSSSPFAYRAYYASWYVNFGDGSVSFGVRSSTVHVRLVRGGQ